jgi:hypothetical protein
VSLFQPAAPNTPLSVIWSISRSWDSPVTDVCLMEAQLDPAASSEKNARPLSGFLPWALHPPEVGERVTLCGLPDAQVQVGRGLGFSGAAVAQSATVTEIFPERRDRGRYSFPGFSVDQEIEGGFAASSAARRLAQVTSPPCGRCSSRHLGGQTKAKRSRRFPTYFEEGIWSPAIGRPSNS